MRYFKNIRRPIRLLVVMGLYLSFSSVPLSGQEQNVSPPPPVYIQILGIAQDAGYPQIACKADCCQKAWNDPVLRRSPVCLGIVDQQSELSWMVEAPPDFKDRWQLLSQTTGWEPGGILITHAHAGHYTGLIQLGKEMMNAQKMPVMVLPRMANYLQNNGPWEQLVSQQNIEIHSIAPDTTYELSKNISYQVLLVPHRDEYSETGAFIINGPSKKLLFVPDIDKWNKWRINMITLIKEVDYALVDGTFFANGELKNRDMSQIPHPFVTESLDLFGQLDLTDRKKIYFIHFNHTNPLVYDDPAATKMVLDAGMNIAQEGLILEL